MYESIFHCLSKDTFLLSFHSIFANLLIESLDAHDDHLSLGARIVDWCCYLVTKSCPTLLRPHGTHQASLSIGFPREEYWSGWSFHSPGDLPDPGIRVWKSESPALQAYSLHSLPSELPRKTFCQLHWIVTQTLHTWFYQYS